MDTLENKVKQILELAGFREPVVNVDEENKKLEIFLNEGEWFKKWLPTLVTDFDHLLKLLTKRENTNSLFVDINNYRKERERLIVELAKAAARKAVIEKQPVRLPFMNAYERRLVHLELSVRPDVTTRSEGEGRERYVVIKPI